MALFEGLIFGGAYIRRGLSTEGHLRLQIDWASLIVRSKLTVFALFYFVFESNFPSTSPPVGLYLEGRFNGGFFASLVWGAYIWRGLYLEGLIFGILRYFNCLNSYFPSNPQPILPAQNSSMFPYFFFDRTWSSAAVSIHKMLWGNGTG